MKPLNSPALKAGLRSALKAGLRSALLMLLTWSMWISADGQNRQWIIKDSQLEVGGSQTLDPLPQPGMYNFADLEYVGQSAQYCQNILQDRGGDLLFFVVDHRVYDQNGFLIDLFPYGGTYLSQEALVFPNPNTCDEYFVVICINGLTNTPELHWMHISTAGGTAVATQTGRHYLNTYYRYSSRTARIAVSEAVDGFNSNGPKTRFIYTSAGNSLAQYRVQGSNIVHVQDWGLNIQASFGGGYNNDDYRTEMELVSVDWGNTKFVLAVPYWSFVNNVSNQPAIALLQLDAHGLPANPITGSPWNANAEEILMQNSVDWPKGLEFSPDGKHLVFTATEAPHLRYIDVQNPGNTWSDLNSLPNINITNPQRFKYGMIEYGKDGFLWVAGDNGDLLPFRALPQYWSNLNAWYHQPSQVISGLPIGVGNANLGSSPRSNLILLQDQIDGEDYGNSDPWGVIGAVTGPASISGSSCGLPQAYSAAVNISGGTPSWAAPVVTSSNPYTGIYTSGNGSLGANMTFQYTLGGCTYSKLKYVNVQCDDGEVEDKPGFGKRGALEGEEFVVYPNPAEKEIRIRGMKRGSLSIVDVLGRVVYERSFVEGERLEVGDLDAGVYTLTAVSEQGRMRNEKLILR